MHSLSRAGLGALALFGIVATGNAQSRFATSVVNFTQGTGSGTFVSTNALGGPQGGGLTAGSLNVCTLGVGGSLTVGFEVVITDGPGADVSVFENAFLFGTESFSEVAYVEVSTNGTDFARFDSRYAGPSTGLSGFTAPLGTYSGLTGFVPIVANVVTNTVDPLDPVVAGGEAFDLADLATHPLVVGGQVNLAAIHFVRIVDVPHATGLDSFGSVIFDNSGATGTADIDAVAVLNHTGSVTANQPRIDFFVDALGFLNLAIEDPNGFADLDLNQLTVSFNLTPVPFNRLRAFLPFYTITANGRVLRSAAPVTSTGILGVLAVTGRDFSGASCSDQFVLQG
jgi:hypothetical protein